MVCAALPTPSVSPASTNHSEEMRQCLDDMRAQIHNVLRLCSLKEHDEIILGAWGCDGQEREYTGQIAELFHEALFGADSGVANSFRRVTFAIPRSPANDTLDVFQGQFKDQRQYVD